MKSHFDAQLMSLLQHIDVNSAHYVLRTKDVN
jgi:hypothetical protein